MAFAAAAEKLIILLLICYTKGCWKKSSPASIPTTTVPPEPIAIHETVQAKSHHGVESARNGGKSNNNKPSTSELKQLSEELFTLDTASVGQLLRIDHQGRSKDEVKDYAPNPLFSSVPKKALEGRTVMLMQKLLDNYEPSVKVKETDTRQEKKEQNAFLDAVLETKVMKKVEEFLQNKNLIRGSLRPQIELIWFTPYSRHRGLLGSSGFEHVFLGELKKGEVSGFHNWVFYQKEERENDANYKGFVKIVDLGAKGEVLKFRFDWLNTKKPVGSMFIGTSPELEMALYTVCFYTRPNKNCNLRLGGKNVSLKVYTQNYNNKVLIGSAYPNIY